MGELCEPERKYMSEEVKEVKEQTVEDINKLEKVKLDKFNELLAEGKNPFLITKYERKIEML